MRVLLVLSAILAVSSAAPQFVFVLPEGLEQLTQSGTFPEVKPFTIDQLLVSEAVEEPVPAVELAVEAEATLIAEEIPADLALNVDPVPETVLAVEEAIPVAEEELTVEANAEAAPVLDATPREEVVFVEEVIPAEETVPVQTTIIEEVFPVEATAPVETTIIEEVFTVEETFPVSEVIVEEVIAVEQPQQAISVAENEVVVDNIPSAADTVSKKTGPVASEAVALGKSLLSAPVNSVPVVASSVLNKIIPAPAINQVDPLAHVDSRFRGFIYPNDSPDIVAAKIALFKVHAQRIPVIRPITV